VRERGKKRERERGEVEMKIKGLTRKTAVRRNPADYEGIGFSDINLGTRATDTYIHIRSRDELFLFFIFFEQRI